MLESEGLFLSFFFFLDFFASEDDWSVVEELLPALEGAVPVVSDGVDWLGCGAVLWSLLLSGLFSVAAAGCAEAVCAG